MHAEDRTILAPRRGDCYTGTLGSTRSSAIRLRGRKPCKLKPFGPWPLWPAGLRTVSSTGVTDDGGSNPLSGYSVVQADSKEAAIELAKSCPHLDHGTIEVAEMMKM